MAYFTASLPTFGVWAELDRLKRRELAESGGAGKYTGASPSAAYMAALDAQTGYPDWAEEHDWTQEDNPAPYAGGRWEEDE